MKKGNSMKKALTLIIFYFLFAIFGLFFYGFFYSLYLNVVNFIVGNEIELFSLDSFIRSIFYAGYCLAFFICPIVAYYRSRHIGGIIQIFAYILLCFFTWFLFVPGLNRIEKFYENRVQTENSQIRLSKGYFRSVGGKTYYFTENFKENENGIEDAHAVIINHYNENPIEIRDIPNSPYFELKTNAKPYSEILIKQFSFNEKLMNFIDFDYLVQKVKKALDNPFYDYFEFLSFAILICSVFALTQLFSWKLLNTASLFFCFSLILMINSTDFFGFVDFLTPRIANNSFYLFLLNFFENPILFCLNILLTLILIIIGIVRVILINLKRRRG